MGRSYFKYIFALLLFGSNGVVASLIDLSSYEIVLLRSMIGSLLLIAIFFLTKSKPTFFKHKKEFICLMISGAAMGLSWMFLYEAYAQIGVSIATLCNYCGPMIVIILSPLIFKERLTAAKIAGSLAVLCGLVLVNGKLAGDSGNIWGLFCGAMSAVTYALLVIFNKKAKPIVGLENSMFQLLFAFLTVAVFVAVKQGFALEIQRSDIAPILMLGLVNTGIGCYFYFSAMVQLPVQTVSICGYLEPLSAVVFSMVFLNEAMTALQIVGGILIIGGAILGESVKVQK